jgi:N-methylhydantoinase B/oxoprolinase/acetone carboxylase alpha subunit
MVMYGVKVCTSPNLPNNEGAWRPITLVAPPGCIVNPQFPAPGRLAHADRPLPADAGVRLPGPDRARDA